MRQPRTRMRVAIATTLSALIATAGLGLTTSSAQAAPTPTPPKTAAVSGPQAKPDIEPGSRDAKPTTALGATKQVKTDANGKLADKSITNSPSAGYVTGVDLASPYNYCWKNLAYTPVTNTTSSTQYFEILLYNAGSYRQLYYSVSPGSTVYPASYGIDGSYYAYLYVWNGSYYQYDEYLGSNNTCNVAVTRTYDTGGWVQLKIQNTGTAYATQVSTELAPYPGSGTYTGTQYDYPAAGGAAVYRWFYVGYSPYGVNSYTYGSWNTPYQFTGDH